MRSLRALAVAASLLLPIGGAFAQTTINTSVPTPGSALQSAPVQGNFLAAGTDINGIITGHPGGSGPATAYLFEDWLNTATSPYVWSKYVNPTVGYATIGTIDPTTGVFTPNMSAVGLLVTPPINISFSGGIATIGLNTDSTLQSAGGNLGINLANANTYTATQAFPNGSIPNVTLANSTISGVALGSNLAALTIGTHLSGTSYNGSAAITIATDATNANTVSTIVARDGSGNFSAGTITAALTGHSSLDLALTGGTMSGNIAMGSNAISGLTTLNGNTISIGTGTLSLGAFTASLGGNLTTAAALTQAGAFATTITSTAATNSTLPAGTHTLAGLDIAQTFSATNTFSGTVNHTGPFQISGTAQTFPASGLIVGTTDTQTLTNKTIVSSTNVLGGVTMTLGSDANGDLYCRSSGVLTRIAGGASAALLTSGGPTVCPTWVAAPGGGNVSNTGTPAANQLAQWTNATTVQGVNVASVLTQGLGIAITGTTNATISMSFTGAVLQGSPTTPTGTTSTSGVMMGLGVTTCRFVPVNSTRAEFSIQGNMNSSLANNFAFTTLRFADAAVTAAPANGVSPVGTQIGGGQTAASPVGSQFFPFNISAIVTGLTVGHTYWIDLDAVSSSASSGVNFQTLSCNGKEVN